MEPYGGAINWMLKTASKLLNEKERSKFVRFVQVQEAEFHKTSNENKNCCNTQENKIILNQIGKTGWIKKRYNISFTSFNLLHFKAPKGNIA